MSKKKGKKGGAKAAKGGKKAPAPKAKAAPAKSGDGAPAGPKAKKNGKEEKAEKKVDLAPLKAKVEETQKELTRAENEASALRKQADGIEGAAKKSYVAALGPYREACRKAGVECEFAGARAANKTPAVRFLVEKVKDGVKVAIKGRPETEQVISKKSLDESVGKAALAYTDSWIGPRDTIGAKFAGLSNRLRAALKAK